MTARLILLSAAVICCAPAPAAEARCLTLAQARELGGYPRYHIHGPKHCWYVRGKDAGAASAARSREATPTAADGKLLNDRADTSAKDVAARTVKTFPVVIQPESEVVQPDRTEAILRSNENGETRPRLSGSESGADTVPYWWEDDRPEAMLMPTRDQWVPPEEVPTDHSSALWWVLGAGVLSVASAGLIASWPRRRARATP